MSNPSGCCSRWFNTKAIFAPEPPLQPAGEQELRESAVPKGLGRLVPGYLLFPSSTPLVLKPKALLDGDLLSLSLRGGGEGDQVRRVWSGGGTLRLVRLGVSA